MDAPPGPAGTRWGDGKRASTCACYKRRGGNEQVPPLQLYKPQNVLIVKRTPRLLLLLLLLCWLCCARLGRPRLRCRRSAVHDGSSSSQTCRLIWLGFGFGCDEGAGWHRGGVSGVEWVEWMGTYPDAAATEPLPADMQHGRTVGVRLCCSRLADHRGSAQQDRNADRPHRLACCMHAGKCSRSDATSDGAFMQRVCRSRHAVEAPSLLEVHQSKIENDGTADGAPNDT